MTVLGGCSGSTAGVGNGGRGGGSPSGSDSVDGAPLFAAPDGDATPNVIYGVWGGSMKEPGVTFDSRMRLARGAITFATRCEFDDGRESQIAAVTAAARVSDQEIAVLESKKDERRTGDITCRATAQPGTMDRCGDDRDGFEHDCFRLSGTTLTIFGSSSLDKVVMTKLSDE